MNLEMLLKNKMQQLNYNCIVNGGNIDIIFTSNGKKNIDSGNLVNIRFLYFMIQLFLFGSCEVDRITV